MRKRLGAVLCATAAASLAAVAPAGAITLKSHGQTVRLARANTNQSSNWFGYNQGSLEKNNTLFTSIAGDWKVPTATQHTSGQDAASSDWIGIGGGCVDAGCTVGDNTLIQTGTEQDVTGGKPSYSAWWEIIPGPSITITNFKVHPGDHMHAFIGEVVGNSDVWTITLKNLTTGKSFSQTVPYSSTHLTAEWIEETPLEIGTNAGFSALPNLTNPRFNNAKVNGANAALTPAEEMQLIDSNGKVIGAPSAPDPDHNGFNACAWAKTCAAPTANG